MLANPDTGVATTGRGPRAITIARMNSPNTSSDASPALPRIAVLATGGTIAGAAPDATSTAGYQAGALGVNFLVDAVPALASIARVDAEQLASIDSKDLALPLWNALVARIDALAADDAIDGIVITHGTDTLEETAYALHLTVKHDKPVVLTAAMRPATALSSDGPLNLLNAVTVAAHPGSRGQGVLVAFNNKIHCARDVVKTSTYAVDAFHSPELGVLGWVQDGRVEFARRATRPHTRDSQLAIGNAWPAVEIVTSYAGVSRTAVDAFVAAGVRGLVVAGTGNGSIHATLQAALAEAAKRGVAVVRASRVGSGHVMKNGAANDDALGFVSAGSLNPFKARVLLMLALANGVTSRDALQAIFDTY